MKSKTWGKTFGVHMIIAAGALLRLFYVLFSTIYERQYDIGMIDLDAGHTITGGHLAYIQYIYHNGMPDFDPTSVYQFQHPPLHHVICAIWMKFCSLFIYNTDVVEEAIQVVPFVCSLLTLWIMYKIAKQLDLSDKAIVFVMAVLAFHPSLVLLSGSVNNDCMALLFTVLIVYWTIEWSRSLSFKAILMLALSIGLGMLVKQNVAEMAFPVAAVFVYVLVKNSKNKNKCKLLLAQFAAFGLVSVPIGMSFYVRNLIKFNMSMFWVYELPTDSWQYTGNVPVINRFLWPIPSEMIDNLLHFKLGCGYNVWMQIIRTSVLGEWDMANVGKPVKLLAVFLMLIGALLAFIALYCFIKVFVVDGIKKAVLFLQKSQLKQEAIPKNMDASVYLLFSIGYFVNMLCYFIFAYKYPQQCSMNFRYIEITLLFPAIAFGIALQENRNKWMDRIAVLIVGIFSVSS
ncbi:MAG: glycosyltransferase family 39 protein, partial [Lachnospiraceae bacterium]|nr:glycosyltransferase family 39 protein [Lachnospiraceae bacterium]